MKKDFFLRVAVAVVGLVAASMVPAYATFTMVLDDGAGHKKTITDGSSMDKSSTAGEILFIGSLGIWSGNVEVALSKPVVGDPMNPQMDLSIQNISSTGVGTLTITISDTGFGPFPGGTGLATLTMGGTLSNGSITGSGQVNGSTVVSLGPFTTSAWNGTASGVVTGLGTSTFSIGEQVVVSHSAAGISGGDIFLTVVPEPTTLIAGALLLLPFGASTLRILRKARMA
jgi:hypothetical protein